MILDTKRRDFFKFYFVRILVVGSAKWTQKKKSGKPTVEALKMSYDEDISSVEAVNKINERAQAKLNAGIYINNLQLSISSRLWDNY